MKVKIKKLHPNAVIPKQMTLGSVGFDLTAVSRTKIDDSTHSYGTGLGFEIPEGYFMLIVPRSSIFKKEMLLSNSVGIIDSDYRGEVKLIYRIGPGEIYIEGDRVGQAIVLPYPKIEFEEVEELSNTERGSGGFGSSGK